MVGKWVAHLGSLETTMNISKKKLPCGYTVIPLIVNGTSPDKSVNDIAQRTFELLEQDSATDKLADNYTLKGLKLHDMIVYSVLWDYKKDQPVLVTGAQHMTTNTCRLFSRYYLFRDYRTGNSNSRYDKVDDFQVDLYHLEHIKERYPFIFWSREKGNKFFRRIKSIRPDVFEGWFVYSKNIELLWKDNWQGILYTNTTSPDLYIDELTFNE